mgnify:CR=1 FL=1
MNYYGQLFLEACAVGVATVIVGLAISFVIIKLKKDTVKASSYGWMALGLFSTGFTLHLLFELLGLNRYYVKHGAASRT